MTTKLKAKPIPPTLARMKSGGMCWISIKGPVTNEQLDVFLTEASGLAGVEAPTYHNSSGNIRCINFGGKLEHVPLLVKAMKELEEELLPEGTQRVAKDEPHPEEGISIRYNI